MPVFADRPRSARLSISLENVGTPSETRGVPRFPPLSRARTSHATREMPKVPRKDTGGATHARERGDAKQARASAATPDASAVADDVPRSLNKIRVQGGAGPLARPSSPDSPHAVDFESSADGGFEPSELDRIHRLAAWMTRVVESERAGYGGFERDLRRRLGLMAKGEPTPALLRAADKLLERTRAAIRIGLLRCANVDPGASLRQENGARQLTPDSWQRSSDACMVNSAEEMRASAPSESSHMLRKHGEPCLTNKISLMVSA